MADHPLYNIMSFYYKGFPSLKESQESLSPVSFHKRYSLKVNGPENWPYIESIARLTREVVLNEHTKKVVLIYSTTDIYKALSNAIMLDDSNRISYCAWHELFVAVHRIRQDVHYLEHFKDILGTADLIMVVGAESVLPEVTDQIMHLTENGCLLFVG